MDRTSTSYNRRTRTKGGTSASFERLSGMLVGFMQTQALFAAVELGLPDIISKTPMQIGRIASRARANESSLYRLLRYLSSVGVFHEVDSRKFVETSLSRGLRATASGAAHWLAMVRGFEWYRAWTEASYSFRTGKPAFERVYGCKFWEYVAHHPERGKVFDRAMAEKTKERLATLASYDWRSVKSVTDVGGGNGTTIASVLNSAPHIRGCLFDLPSVIRGAEKVLQKAGVRTRCEIVAGDFFKNSIPVSDALILSQVLHDWDDSQAHKILVNCRQALDYNGLLLLVEGVVPETNEPNFLKLMDLHMLVLFGSKERTESEWRAMLEGARFRLVKVLPSGLIEARAT